jgi:segregation and condensation protein A
MSDQAQAPEEQQVVEGPQQDFIVDEATDEVLRLNLDQFQGPLDVLLYLIKSQEIDIFDIPIAKITDQYLAFLALMEDENLDVTGDFIVMNANLILIKSKMILPVEVDDDDEEIEEEDPRLELVNKLLEYRQFRDVQDRLAKLEEDRQGWFARNVKPEIEKDPNEEEYLEVSLYDLMQAFRGVARYLRDPVVQTIHGEESSVDEKIERIQFMLAQSGSASWTELFEECKNKIELVCCFLAILELCRMNRVRAHQHKTFQEIRLFAVAEESAA